MDADLFSGVSDVLGNAFGSNVEAAVTEAIAPLRDEINNIAMRLAALELLLSEYLAIIEKARTNSAIVSRLLG